MQTLSHTYCNLIGELDRLAAAGVSSLRLSPHDLDMVAVATTFRARLDGDLDAEGARAALQRIAPLATFSNGFLVGRTGAEYVSAS